MNVSTLKVDPGEVEQLHRAYKEHQHFETDVDREIRQTYAALEKGDTVIQALASIPAAGVNDAGLPKLAIVQADAKTCFMEIPGYPQGNMRMSHTREGASGYGNRKRFAWPLSTFPGLRRGNSSDYQAIVPLIPLHLRPRTALDQYHILFEAEWTRIVPKDPYLLRRIGASDLWVVVAAWDLTEVERAVLQARVPVN